MENTLTEILKEILSFHSINGSDLARALGRSRSMICRWLNGERRPAPADLLDMITVYHIDDRLADKLWSARFPALDRFLRDRSQEFDGMDIEERIEFFEAAAVASVDI